MTALDVVLLTADLVLGWGDMFGSQWGIFSGGGAVVEADTVVDLTYKQDWVIADYPLEGGQFENYDKVATPYDVRIRFVAGGSESNRSSLLSSVAYIAGDFEFYDVVTPEAVYVNCNVRHYDYHRSSTAGLGLLTVDVWLQEIRVNVISGSGGGFGGASAPSGADQINGGAVQAAPATSAQSAAATGSPPAGVSFSNQGWAPQ